MVQQGRYKKIEWRGKQNLHCYRGEQWRGSGERQVLLRIVHCLGWHPNRVCLGSYLDDLNTFLMLRCYLVKLSFSDSSIYKWRS